MLNKRQRQAVGIRRRRRTGGQFSRDVDLAVLASDENFPRLLAALAELGTNRIAVPRFDAALLARGHAVHFRCHRGDADGLRGDVMTRLRDLPDFNVLWARRATISDQRRLQRSESEWARIACAGP